MFSPGQGTWTFTDCVLPITGIFCSIFPYASNAIMSYWLIYFIPSLIAWLYKDRKSPLLHIVLVNVLTGWTYIGWIVALAMIFIDERSLASSTRQSSTPQAEPFGQPNASQGPSSCGSCNGSGQQNCSSCFGNRGQWHHPQTESGSSVWEQCSSCIGSGSMQCFSCGGSGKR